MKLGIVLFPSKELQEEVNHYRKRYDDHYANIPPHITVKEVFEVSNENEAKQVVNAIEEKAKSIDPVDINVEKVSNFAPTKNVVYLKITPTESLQALYDAFNNEDFYGEATHPFVPHITLAQGLNDQEFEDVIGHLSLYSLKHQETIHKIALCYQLDNGQWTTFDMIKLGQ